MAGSLTPLTFEYPIDTITPINAQYYIALQNNFLSYVSQFLPLVGAQMQGAILWDPTQTFPGAQVTVPNPSYPHSGYYTSVIDHINDAQVHGAPVVPLPHAATHAIGGADPLYGTTLAVASGGTTSIKSYIDSQVSTYAASAFPGPPASSRYEIGGADPLYGNLIAVDSAHPTLDLRTYVTNSVSAAIATGGGSTNPTYNNLNLTTGVINTLTGNLTLQSKGTTILASDGVSSYVSSTGNTYPIYFGYTGSTAGAYGQVSSSGYTIGSSSYGPNGLVANGSVVANGDFQTSRTAAGNSAQGAVFLGVNTNAYISYNADIPSQLYLSKNTSFGGNVAIAAGKSFSLTGLFSVGNVINTATPGIRSDGNSLFLNAGSGPGGRYIAIGADNNTLSAVYVGPLDGWATFTGAGMAIGSTVISSTGGAIAGALSLHGGYTGALGDLGVARNASSGAIFFGTTGAGQIDYGLTTGSTISFTIGSSVSNIKSDGSYNFGSSSYGAAATVAGVITGAKAVTSGIGLDVTGNAGFSFGSSYSTGVFSASAGDLRLLVSGVSNLISTPATTTITNNLTTTGNFVAVNGTFSGTTTIAGQLSLSGSLLAGSTTISQYRIKFLMNLGSSFHNGTASLPASGDSYAYVPSLTYNSGRIEALRLTSVTTDTGGVSTSYTIYKNGTVMGTIQLGTGQTTALALPTTNPTPIASGDVMHAVCTATGGATGVAIYAECSQLLY